MTIISWPFYANCNYCGKRIVFRTHLNNRKVLVEGNFCDEECQEASWSELEPPKTFKQFHAWNKTFGGGPPLEFVLEHIPWSAYDLKYLKDIYVCYDEYYEECKWVGRDPTKDAETGIFCCPKCEGTVESLETVLERYTNFCALLERAQRWIYNDTKS